MGKKDGKNIIIMSVHISVCRYDGLHTKKEMRNSTDIKSSGGCETIGVLLSRVTNFVLR